jgi:hypothetical protein
MEKGKFCDAGCLLAVQLDVCSERDENDAIVFYAVYRAPVSGYINTSRASVFVFKRVVSEHRMRRVYAEQLNGLQKGNPDFRGRGLSLLIE